MRITNLSAENQELIQQAATLLVDGFREHWPNAWPNEFYQKLGYVIVGVIPDVNGLGKPDIIMAKRVGKKLTAHLQPGGGRAAYHERRRHHYYRQRDSG